MRSKRGVLLAAVTIGSVVVACRGEGRGAATDRTAPPRDVATGSPTAVTSALVEEARVKKKLEEIEALKTQAEAERAHITELELQLALEHDETERKRLAKEIADAKEAAGIHDGAPAPSSSAAP